MAQKKIETSQRLDSEFLIARRGGDPHGVFYYRRELDKKSIWKSLGTRDPETARIKGTEYNKEVNDRKHGFDKRREVGNLPIVRDYVQTHLAGHVKTLDAKTQADYPFYLEQFAASRYGAMRLDEPKTSELQAYVNEHCRLDGKDSALNTRRRLIMIIRGMWTHAQDDYDWLKNPMKKVKFGPADVRTRVLTSFELPIVLSELEDNLMYLRATTILVQTGLRVSEFLAPVSVDGQRRQWPTVKLNFKTHQIFVPKAIAKYKIARTIPMLPDVEAAYREQLAALAAGEIAFYRKEQKVTAAAGAAFPLKRHTIAYFYRRLCDRIGLDPFTTHDLRRTFGTENALKMYPKALQTVMGHKNLATTMLYYVHLDENTYAEGMTAGVGSFFAEARAEAKRMTEAVALLKTA